MEVHLRVTGFIFIILSLIHAIFPFYFGWKKDLAPLSLINRQMMQVHTFFIAFAVFLVGTLCIYSAEDLVHTRLGKQICLGLSVFWFARLIFQFFVYSSDLWRGKRFETTVHILFAFLWTYCSVLFFLVFWRK